MLGSIGPGMTYVAFLSLFRLLSPCLFSRSTFSHIFPSGYPLPFDSPPSHARASPDSHLLSLLPRSALRMPFLDDFSSCRVVIPVHSSLFIQRNHCHCFRGTIQQYCFVTLGVLNFSQLVDMSSHWLFNSTIIALIACIWRARYAIQELTCEPTG